MKKIKWYEQEEGVISAMRIAMMIGVITGVIGFIFAIVMSIIMFITTKWEIIPVLTTLLASSAGIMAVGDIAKSIQKRSERKKE